MKIRFLGTRQDQSRIGGRTASIFVVDDGMHWKQIKLVIFYTVRKLSVSLIASFEAIHLVA
jgi:hypothetical protein